MLVLFHFKGNVLCSVCSDQCHSSTSVFGVQGGDYRGSVSNFQQSDTYETHRSMRLLKCVICYTLSQWCFISISAWTALNSQAFHRKIWQSFKSQVIHITSMWRGSVDNKYFDTILFQKIKERYIHFEYKHTSQ